MVLSQQFTDWYFNRFHQTSMFRYMLETVEGTPWHREANVGGHTDMVVKEYLALTPHSWNNQTLSGALACAFHDVGKPPAMVVKESPERGKYNSFAGHEQISARMWEDFACTEWSTFSSMGLKPSDMYSVGWMVDNHLPFGIKKPHKRQRLGETVKQMRLQEVFPNVLLADQRGRTSDVTHQKLVEVEQWIANFLQNWC